MHSHISLQEGRGGRCDKEKKEHCDHRGRAWSDAVASQGMPSVPRSWKRQRMDSPLESLEGVLLALLTLDFSPAILTFGLPASRTLTG